MSHQNGIRPLQVDLLFGAALFCSLCICLFIIDGAADHLNNLTTCTCLATTVMNCWSSVFNYWFRMVGMIVIVRIYSASTKCTVLPWTIISMAEEKHSFIDFFVSNITSRLAGSKWIMNNEPPTHMSSSISRVKSSYVIYHSKLIPLHWRTCGWFIVSHYTGNFVTKCVHSPACSLAKKYSQSIFTVVLKLL